MINTMERENFHMIPKNKKGECLSKFSDFMGTNALKKVRPIIGRGKEQRHGGSNRW